MLPPSSLALTLTFILAVALAMAPPVWADHEEATVSPFTCPLCAACVALLNPDSGPSLSPLARLLEDVLGASLRAGSNKPGDALAAEVVCVEHGLCAADHNAAHRRLEQVLIDAAPHSLHGLEKMDSSRVAAAIAAVRLRRASLAADYGVAHGRDAGWDPHLAPLSHHATTSEIASASSPGKPAAATLAAHKALPDLFAELIDEGIGGVLDDDEPNSRGG